MTVLLVVLLVAEFVVNSLISARNSSERENRL